MVDENDFDMDELRMLGVPIKGSTLVYGDNMSEVTNCTIPSSSLKKKWHGISYHKVREAVAAGIIRLFHVPSKDNLADILRNPLGPIKHFPLMKAILK